jgi:hypothetical protein
MTILEVWADTGEAVERDRTPEEQAQFEADQTAAVKAEKDRVKKETADKAATEAAIAHAKSLGFTNAMIAVMYPALSTT